MAKKLYEKVSSERNWELVVSKHMDLYKEVMGKGQVTETYEYPKL